MSSKLLESITVGCPYNLAKTFLHERYNDVAAGRKTLTFTLHGAGLTRDVIATIKRGDDSMHFDEPWIVEWRPLEGGPFPSFHGELTVRADYDYTTSILELQGEYQPPFGAAGAAFDALAGQRIASQTARYLLAELAGELEQRYRKEEFEKKALNDL
jgi:hypothetical protein